MNDYRHGLGDQLPPMVCDFFATFARFEYALTRGGVLTGEIGDQAEAHWDRFANALGDPFLLTMRTAPQADVFFTDPPKKLFVIGDDEVEFRRTADVETCPDLFVLLRRVRNNLFHGQKVLFDDRDSQLIEAALFVLDQAFDVASRRQDLRRMTTAFAYAAINPY